MALKKREINKENKEKKIENEVKEKITNNEKKNSKNENNVANSIKSVLITLLTFIILTGGVIVYLKYKQPQIYNDKISKYFITTIPVSESPITKSPVSEKPINESPVNEKPVTTNSEKAKKITIEDLTEESINDFKDILNADELFFMEKVLQKKKEKKIIEENPDINIKNVQEYYDEPIGQMIKRIGLSSPVVLFINTQDEKSKVARLAVSASKVPFSVMEVDTEPRAGEISQALFRMTSQRSYPYVFINGNFFGTSLELKNIMKSKEYDRMIIEGKDDYLKRREKFQETIEKRKKDKEEREKRKLEKILKKLEENL